MADKARGAGRGKGGGGENSFEVASEDGATVLVFQVALDRSRAGELWAKSASAVENAETDRIIVDGSRISGYDSAGVALLRLIKRHCEDLGKQFETRGLQQELQDFIEFVEDRTSGERGEGQRRIGFVRKLGTRFQNLLSEGRALAEFTGKFCLAAMDIVRRPKNLRFLETVYHFQRAGAEAWIFLVLLGALMGFIMALQSSATLSQFGAAIRVAQVVTFGTVKEMAPLLTAIILVGRSGAAFAAEIGTMKIKEEIDALRVMGIGVMNFLVVPRVLGIAVAGPLLTLLTAAAGIIGGSLTAFMALEIAFENYFTEASQSFMAVQLIQGLVKSIVFSLLIGLNSCFHGMQAGTAPEEVGLRTTSAVVSGIILIVVADALFSGIFHVYGFI